PKRRIGGGDVCRIVGVIIALTTICFVIANMASLFYGYALEGAGLLVLPCGLPLLLAGVLFAVGSKYPGGGMDVLPKRFYPELSIASIICFSFCAAMLLLAPWWLEPELSIFIRAQLAPVLAAIGSALWVVKTVLEVGFHLQEQIREMSRRVGSAGAIG